MVDDQLRIAADFIRAKRYEDARRLLRTIDHPKAREWLARLDAVEAQAVLDGFQASGAPAARSYTAPPAASYPPYAAAAAPAATVSADKPVTLLSLPLAVVGALLGAALGAVIWIVVAYVIGYEVGLIAIGVGALAGLGAVALSGGRRGLLIQLIAVIAGFLGVLAGKYLATYALLYISGESLTGDGLSRTLRLFPPFDPVILQTIYDLLSEDDDILDLVFIIIAVIAAWRIAARQR